MKKRKYFVVLLATLGGALSGCYSYTPPSAAVLSTRFTAENRTATDGILTQMTELSLADADKIAVMNNLSYRATLHYVDAARMRYYQSLGAYAPEIHFGVAGGQQGSWATNMVNPPMNLAGRNLEFQVSTAFTSSWLLFDGFARYLTTQVAKHDLAREKAVADKVRCMLRRSVAYAYYDIQLAETIMRIQQENIDFQNRLYTVVLPEYQQHTRPQDEVLNFQILAGFGETARLAALDQRQVANFALSLLMGYTEGALPGSLSFPAQPEELPPVYYSVDACIDIALDNNPDMHIMRELLDMAYYNKLKSYSAFAPDVYADFAYQNMERRNQYRDYRDTHSSYNSNSLAYNLRADWLIFNGFARYNAMREMQSAFAGAQFEMGQTYLNILNDIQAAYTNYEISAKQYEIYKKLLPEAKLQRDLVMERYLKWHASVDRMDKVQQYYVDTQVNLASAITNYQKAIAQLEAIMMTSVY